MKYEGFSKKEDEIVTEKGLSSRRSDSDGRGETLRSDESLKEDIEYIQTEEKSFGYV